MKPRHLFTMSDLISSYWKKCLNILSARNVTVHGDVTKSQEQYISIKYIILIFILMVSEK